MGRVRNARCSGCQKPVSAGKCIGCTRTQRAERWHERFPDMGRRRTLREQIVETQTGKRRCSRCASWKPLGEYHWNGDRLRSDCKVCFREKDRERAAGVRRRRRAGDEHLRQLRRDQKRRARARVKSRQLA